MTKHGEEPLPSEEEHCSVVEVTEEEVKNSVKLIPSWTTVVRGGKGRILLSYLAEPGTCSALGIRGNSGASGLSAEGLWKPCSIGV